MKIFLALFVLILIACSDSSSSSGSANEIPENLISEDAKHPEMLAVKSSGVSIQLGEMTAEFSYDFSIDKHEVTCGEFQSLMKMAKCENKNLPITNVTFYDAVLFANAKSKSENLDTVYIYNEASFDSDGNCTNLSGYQVNFKKNGYRLPTEAEWVLVAKANWNPKNSWNAENSDYQLQPICTAKDTAGKTCDFAGNALEWINDWMGNFSKTTVVDFVGASDGGNLGERILKGGSFRNSAEAITLENRKDIYTVTSATKANYVGFRLALGKISNPTWLDSKGSATNSPIRVLASSGTLKKFTQTFRNKLVFRNDETGNLTFVNYANGLLSATEIVDTLDAYHPAISPDGKRVAFCTKPEGISGKSALYVRDLNSDGSNLVKLDVESAAIPRWRIVAGDTEIVYVSSTGNNANETDWKKESTWSVKFSGGKFGEPQKIFAGTFNAGVSSNNQFALSGARLLRANVNGKNVIWYGEEQACNASFSDSTKQTLFLDFGGKLGQEFSGKSYAAHEEILIADSLGKLTKMIPAPENFTFDHTEWVQSQKNFAVASLTNSDGAHTKIALVNTLDSSVTELVEGAELWHPDLWVGNSQNENAELDLDSAGMYLPEDYDYVQSKYRLKMELYWENLPETEILCVGSSRMEWGLNPELYPERKMFNMAVSGIDINREMYFVKNYVMRHAENLKAIVFSMDIDNYRGMRGIAEKIFAASGYVYDANHQFWENGIPKNFIEAVKEAPGDREFMKNYTQRGYIHSPSKSWGNSPVEILSDTIYTETEAVYMDQKYAEFFELVDQFAALNIYVIAIIFPQNPEYKNTGSFGRYGPQRSVAKKRIAWLDSIAKVKPNFILMDENKMGDHDYTDEMALDYDHLSYLGANQVTTRLDSVLKTLP